MTKSVKKDSADIFAASLLTPETLVKGANDVLKETEVKVNGYLSSLRTMGEELNEVLKASGSRTVKGVTDYDAEVKNFAKDAIAASFENAKALANVKTFDEAVKLQSTYLSGRVEATTAWVKTLTEISQKSWTEAVMPLTEAAKDAAKKASSLAA